MKARALATFRMQKDLIRIGDIFDADEEYIRALARNRLAEFVDGTCPEPEPQPAPETKPAPEPETKPAPKSKKKGNK